MSNVEKFTALYEQGTYTFGEAVCYFIRLVATEAPETYVHELSADFLINIAEQVAVPLTSSHEISYRQDNGTLAQEHFQGAQRLREYLFGAAADY